MTETPQAVAHFFVKQRFTFGVKRYQFHESDAEGGEGRLLAFAQQKRFKIKDEVVFFTDDSKTERVFSYKARNYLDLSAATDVFDASGAPIGEFSTDFAKSLVNSTWRVTSNGLTFTGQERSMALAIMRRLSAAAGFVPFHFDFVGPEGAKAFSVEKAWGLRDKYKVPVYDQRIDWRVLGAMSVALDAMMER